MRRIVIAVMSTISGLVLLFSYHTSTNSGAAVALGGAGDSTGTGGSTGTGTGTATGAAAEYTGDEVMTRWGVVQVKIQVAGGRVTSADTVQVPMENHRDVEINTYAVPILNQAAVDAQGPDFDNISGATVTTDGYKQSLQSAIDQAHL